MIKKHFSKEHKKKLSISRIGKYLGKDHPNWKGGIRKAGTGRISIYSPNHPFTDKCKYVLRARLEMEKHIGRTLLQTEVVHHINGDMTDDRIENLMLFSNTAEHSRYHYPKKSKFGKNKKGGEK